DASGTGWLDVRRRDWSSEMLAATDPDRDLRECLPPLVPADHLAKIRPALADELGLPHSVRVSAGGGDNMMAAIGTGNVVPGVLSMSLGTSGTIFTYADRAVVDDQGRWAAFCDSTGGWLPLICTMNCTVATESVARLCGFSTRDGARSGDNMMAAIGTGNVVPGVLSMSLGTSGTIFTYADRAVVDDQGRWAAFCDSTGGWLPLICTMNCTVATESVARLCGFSTRDGD